MDLLGWLRSSSLSISVLTRTSATSILGDVLVCLLPRPSPSGKELSDALGDAGGLAGGSGGWLLVSGAELVCGHLGILYPGGTGCEQMAVMSVSSLPLACPL